LNQYPHSAPRKTITNTAKWFKNSGNAGKPQERSAN
jgi:hypothetical protein